MDINLNAEVKAYGVPVTPVIEREDKTKAQVAPVQKNGESQAGSLNDEALHGQPKKAENGAEAARITKAELRNSVNVAQSRLDDIGGNLSLGLHEQPDDGTIVVQIRDKRSNKVVRQIPSKAIMELRVKLDELAGLLFDKNA
ncbi:hypothetical protein MNBD_DELTA03-46 [hydrothermal vent metagenome]|uniref:Flagellar protein FlaG n=1 Tax=hydrothermal vent metagenome TaxID=652676 RepID=A0A3B0VTD8_9ZZZZ